jgi:hypothetical protein
MRIAQCVGLCIIALLAGCARDVPYRDLGFKDIAPDCKQKYAAYDQAPETGPFPVLDDRDSCWRRSKEEHDDYDLLFVEFDDQGWPQGSSGLALGDKDFIDTFVSQLEQVFEKETSRNPERGLSLVVYVHGWHHNAAASDEDVHSFRRLLKQIATMEGNLARAGYHPMRVVGVYVGWRGESVEVPLLRKLTFWDRKNAAQRVSQGSVRELLKRLDHFRDAKRTKKGNVRNVRMLTIGHSFGGLITFESLSSEFLRNSVRFRENPREDTWMSRVGDLVVIVNPAFEGTRYEPLRAAAPRLRPLERNQLPVLIIATSEGDWATKYAFPFARQFSTMLEERRSEEQFDATVMALGHNARYITHDLRLGTCQGDCSKACRTAAREPGEKIKATVEKASIDAEYELMRRIEDEGVGPIEYLCSGLELKATQRWRPDHNPFWVVRTSKGVIDDHGDIFNPNFVAFLRQMYLGFIFARSRPLSK